MTRPERLLCAARHTSAAHAIEALVMPLEARPELRVECAEIIQASRDLRDKAQIVAEYGSPASRLAAVRLSVLTAATSLSMRGADAAAVARDIMACCEGLAGAGR